MENYENKELLKDAAKKSLESLKDLKPGTDCLLYTSPSPRDPKTSRMPSSA